LLFILFLYIFFLLQSVAFYTLIERHVLGLTQNRFGPKKTSWFGLLQPIIDGLKLCKKENIYIFNCSSRVFIGAAVLSFCVFYMEFICLPYPFNFITIYWGYLMVLLLLGVNVYYLLVCGIYSKSKYSYLGGMRRAVASVRFEVTFSINVLTFALYHKSYEVGEVGNVGLLLYFLVFFISALVELSRTPFDYSESESELVSGLNTEYRRVGFVLLFIKEYGSLLFFSVLTADVFIGGIFAGAIAVFFCLIVIRRSFPRLRYDKCMEVIWLESFFHVVLTKCVFTAICNI